jgi:protease-4
VGNPKSEYNNMKQFFKYVLATITGLVALMLIFFLLFASIVASSSKGKEVTVKDNSVLHIKLNYMLQDRPHDNPFDQIAFDLSGGDEAPVGLIDVIQCLEKAKDDDKIKGVFLDLSALGAGYGKLSEVRNALEDFKSSGKFVYAYGEVFYNQSYYFASVADKIYLNPSGTILFNGLAADITFMKRTLEKLGVEMQVIKRGKFKGAVEPFVLDELSPENRRQITDYVESIYGEMLSGISKSRDLTIEELRTIANEVSVKSPKDAERLKLIDGVVYRDNVMTQIQNDLGEEKEPNMLSLSKYNKSRTTSGGKLSKNKIAVVYASGDIVSGKGGEGQIGSDKFAETLRKLRENDKVKAVVLRVNSPGGSALASDVIWRETQLLKAKKPVIVSMGDVAASGGYFISCGADSIFAMPNSVTGSIGVFALYPNAEALYEKLGLKTDVVKTSSMADFGRIDRPLNEQEKELLDVMIGDVYEQFLGRVTEGRGLDRAHLDTIAQGRVWTGEYAKRLGLIDEFGGLEKAIEVAAYKAGIEDDYALRAYPKSDNPFEEIFSGFTMSSIKNKIVKEELGEYYSVYNKMERLKSLTGIQALMPFDINLN